MRIALLALITLAVFSSACAEPQCPPDYVMNRGRCKRCPEGSDSKGDQCISADGGTTVSHVQADDDAGMNASVSEPLDDAGLGPDSGSVLGPDAATPSENNPTKEAGTNPMSLSDADTSVVDTGVAAPDPCQGIPQCTACSNDGQCPDPGACLSKHCNTGKGICEPAFVAAETACGASKCDGAGKCVGCLGDNDCGAPGECKVRHCNQATHVCEPTNAPTTTSCPTGHCDQGACVQCSSASECADKTCQTKSCSSGQCRYANVPAGQKGGCTTGVCTAGQRCAECVFESDCDRLDDGLCSEGACVNNACQATAKTGSCGPLKMCSGTSCVNSCGTNQIVDTEAGEECDPSRVPYNNWTCNSATCKLTGYSTTAYRKVCASGGDAVCATNETCSTRYLECVPKCIGTSCPSVPGYAIDVITSGEQCSTTNPCVVFCTTNSQCPPGVRCLIPSGSSSGVCKEAL